MLYAWGGGYLACLSDGDVPFFRVMFSPLFSRARYQKKANFLEQVFKTCQKRKFCYNGLLFSQIFVFLSILSQIFSRTGYHLKANILEQGEKFFFVGTSPYKLRSSTPRGLWYMKSRRF